MRRRNAPGIPYAELSDYTRDIKNLTRSLGKEKDLEELDERLTQLSRLKRKYGPTLGLDEQNLIKALGIAEGHCGAAALELHKAREKKAIA
jgi:hypothetical protein